MRTLFVCFFKVWSKVFSLLCSWPEIRSEKRLLAGQSFKAPQYPEYIFLGRNQWFIYFSRRNKPKFFTCCSGLPYEWKIVQFLWNGYLQQYFYQIKFHLIIYMHQLILVKATASVRKALIQHVLLVVTSVTAIIRFFLPFAPWWKYWHFKEIKNSRQIQWGATY